MNSIFCFASVFCRASIFPSCAWALVISWLGRFGTVFAIPSCFADSVMGFSISGCSGFTSGTD